MSITIAAVATAIGMLDGYELRLVFLVGYPYLDDQRQTCCA
jgi:hypothetical protein